MRTVILVTVLFSSLALFAGCPQQDSATENAATDEPASSVERASASRLPDNPAESPEINWFFNTQLQLNAPLALDIDLAGKQLFVQFRPAGTQDFRIAQMDIPAAGPVEPHTEHYASPRQGRAYLKSHPTENECLVLRSSQESPGEPVIDVVLRAHRGELLPVNYRSAQGMPEADSNTSFNLEPFYSWDGSMIIVPLHDHGLSVVERDINAKAQFVDYLDTSFEVVGQTAHPLPDQDGRRIALIRWFLGDPDFEPAQIDILNLDTLEWEASVEVGWPVYEISAQDIVNGPWLLSGSRFPQVNTEQKRVPRLARVDPASGALDIMEFYGEPYWFVRLSPDGRYVVYMDQQREALVRLEVETGMLDIDYGWYDKEAELLITPDASQVYAYKDNIFYKSGWDETKQADNWEAP